MGPAKLGPLRQLDEVAYLRFASVYRAFESADDFEVEIALLRAERALASDERDLSPATGSATDRPACVVGKLRVPGAPTSSSSFQIPPRPGGAAIRTQRMAVAMLASLVGLDLADPALLPVNFSVLVLALASAFVRVSPVYREHMDWHDRRRRKRAKRKRARSRDRRQTDDAL